MQQMAAVGVPRDPGDWIFTGESDPVKVRLPEQYLRVGLTEEDFESGGFAKAPKLERVAVVRKPGAELAAAAADLVELRGPATKGGFVDPILDRKLGTQDIAVPDCEVVFDLRVEGGSKAVGTNVTGDDPDSQIVE